MGRGRPLLTALLAVIALIGAACTESESAGPTTDISGRASTTVAVSPNTARSPVETDMPGDGTNIAMARADSPDGYFRAAVYRELLQELGYSVGHPSNHEFDPSSFYPALATGEVDFWVNSRLPEDEALLLVDLPDGAKVGDLVEVLGNEMPSGRLSGYLITRSVADQYGISTIDQINDDPAIAALFDTDGDGRANVLGCQEGRACADAIARQIAVSGWDRIEQDIARREAMEAEAVSRVATGSPMIVHARTPSALMTKLVPGRNVVWLAVEPADEQPETSDPDGADEADRIRVTAAIPVDQCPDVAYALVCRLGFPVSDIAVAANRDFLAGNPAARSLLEDVELSVLDVSAALVEQSRGCDADDCIDGLARMWIENHTDAVGPWLIAARAAA